MPDNSSKDAGVSRKPGVELGATEKMMVQLLQEDGRMATAEIARRLGISEPTVRKKLGQLLGDGAISVQAIARPMDIGYEISSYVGIETEWVLLNAVANALKKFPFIETISITAGPYHIIIKAHFESPSHQHDFLLHDLTKIKGIKNTYSFLIFQDIKNSVAPCLE